MSLSLALNNALSGLNVNQTTLSTISNNIANANTEGYSRQIVDQSALILDGVGAGARIDAISRKIDVYLERAIQREKSNVGKAEEIADYYQRIQILLGEPGADNSIDEYVESFFNSLQALAETPDRVSFQATAVDTAEVLARELSGLARSLEDLRFQADQDISEAVDEINVELAHLDSLNLAINRAAALGSSTAGLLDQRDLSLEKLAEFMDIEIYYQETGAVNVFTANGIGLVDENRHELSYRQVSGINALINNQSVNPIQVLTFDDDGEQVREPDNLTGSGVEAAVTSRLEAGSLEGLRELRDELLPDLLAQLDELAAGIRDSVNAIHNDGSGFPPAGELTGTRQVRADEAFDWTGVAQIAVLNADGTPAPSIYPDENHTGYRPLNLDFDFLQSGFGAGVPTTQTIIDEINNHFNAPPVKATIGNLNNMQLVSNNTQMPQGIPPTFTFDMDLENIANFGSDFWITGVNIVDDLGAAVGSSATGEVTNTAPAFDIASYDFQNGQNVVTVNTTLAHGMSEGDRVFLEDPGGGPYAGLLNTDISGYFTISNVTGNSFQITLPPTVNATATAAGVAPANPANARPPYEQLEAGEKTRTRNSGTFTADLSANSTAAFYDITLSVGVFDEDPAQAGQFPVGTVTYRVFNNNNNLLNDRYDVSAATTGAASRVFPGTPHQYIFARLVDENGVELPRTNGSYGTQSGFLQLVANDLGEQDFRISINEGDSRQQGQITLPTTPVPGTNRGFSHYYELNNLFASNNPTAAGDTTTGSAINFAVEQEILDNPSLISTGEAELSNQPADPDGRRLYTYERYIGNNSVAQRLAGLSFTSLSFSAAGGLPDSTQTINGYVGEILGFIATKTVTAEASFRDTETLLNGFVQRADAISGVNLDEELANMTLYQNAYVASARVISVTDEMFAELLGTFN